jgi:peroxiredoxin
LLHLIERDERGPALGETAPDFTLKQVGSDERVSLSGFRGKRPVGLIFGSYT